MKINVNSIAQSQWDILEDITILSHEARALANVVQFCISEGKDQNFTDVVQSTLSKKIIEIDNALYAGIETLTKAKRESLGS